MVIDKSEFGEIYMKRFCYCGVAVVALISLCCAASEERESEIMVNVYTKRAEELRARMIRDNAAREYARDFYLPYLEIELTHEDFIKYTKEKAESKSDALSKLCKKHEEECRDNTKKALDRLAQGEAIEIILKEKLIYIIKAREEQSRKRRELLEADDKKGLEIEEKYEQALEAFKKTL